MKTDKKLLFAVLVLIGLVTWLLVISTQRNREINREISIVSGLESRVQQLQTMKPVDGRDGYTPVKGVDYVDGINGQNGVLGLQGQPGQPGPQGLPGQSAYSVWQAAGNQGSIEDFLQSLKGEKGDAGQTPLLRTDPDTGNLEFKNPSDVFWQVWLKKCDVLGSCDEAN